VNKQQHSRMMMEEEVAPGVWVFVIEEDQQLPGHYPNKNQ
jgi:hypothetical protein